MCADTRPGCAGATNGATAQPLLPPALQAVYLRLKAYEVELYQKRMAQLAQLPDPQRHIPAHALDEQTGTKPQYPPEDLLKF